MLNETIWHSITASQHIARIAPTWVLSTLKMPFSEVLRLPPPIDAPTENKVMQPTLELTEITSSYLAFLRRQIKLEPRGKEWTEVLEARLNALTPYEGGKLFRLSVIRMHEHQVETFLVRLRPEDFGVVHFECP